MGRARIGVDIGGTFTDVVCVAPGVPPRSVKLPSTPDDPSRAVLAAVEHAAASWGVAAADVAAFVHGTTVATNAVIERKGARIGLLTTAGFRDVLEIGRQMRQQLYEVALKPETPVFLAPGAFRRAVPERVAPDGSVLVPLDETAVAAAADALAAAGARAIAICFLHAYANPAHERRAAEILRARHPGLDVSLSSEVDPAFREYERTVVTAFDAYIKPVVDRYLGNLEAGLEAAGVAAPLRVMQSRGGVAASTIARRRPVRLFLSGPAAGVIGGRMAGTAAGLADLITVDVGGTSSDIALVSDSAPLIRQEGVIAGYPVRVSMVDVNAIGAGGGSIAWIDGAGGLRVGPHSAGADPGPACYGKRGAEATVTDASVVLGYLDPAYFAGGTVALDPARAASAVRRRVAEPLGLSLEAAALGIHRVVNAQMCEGIRLVSIRRGFDPRRFALVALGGAGPVHGTALARELGVRTVVVPLAPGVLSAAGLLAAPVEHEVSAAVNRDLAGLTLAEIRAVLARLDDECAALMALEKLEKAAPAISYAADLCYVGQSHHLEVAIDVAAADPLARLAGDFRVAHDQVYGHATEGPLRVVNLRSVHRVAPDAAAEAPYAPSGAAARKTDRRAIFAEGGAMETAILDRLALAPGERISGPAIVEQDDTTTVIEPGWQGEVLANGTLLLRQA